MSQAALGMLTAGTVVLAAGVVLAATRVKDSEGLDRLFVLAPIFEASALAGFGAEHFYFAQAFAFAVPRWLPWHLFWVYLVGVALLATSLSMIAWRSVRWSATLFGLMMIVFVATIHVPNLLHHAHERLFWTLVFRESSFAAGALVLAASLQQHCRAVRAGRIFLGVTLMFFAVQHFAFPRFAPGVPLQKMTPPWIPGPVLLAYVVGLVLLCAGSAMLFDRTARVASAIAGGVLLLLTAFFYAPIMVTELRTPLAVEGVNYVLDTMLFASSVLFAGYRSPGSDLRAAPEKA
jgi:uncharacterized membrane protein